MKGSLYTNFISKRNFADVSASCSSLLYFRKKQLVETSAKFLSEIKLIYREPFIVYARAN